MKKLFLMDANSLIHRAFHALPPLTSADGKPSQAIYGVASILLKIRREDKPDYIAALFDRPEPTFREKEYKEYKAQRPATPDNLVPQLIEAQNLFHSFGIRTFEKAGFEADDLIATLAEKFYRTPDLKIIVLTGDLDTLQLVRDDRLVVRALKKGVSDTITYDEKAVRDRFGLRPNQLIDYKAFVGDASDNIKGVPGIGPKTAQELLQKYKTLERIYKNLDDDPKIKERIGKWKEEAELSKKLVTLEKKAPIELKNIEELKVPDSKNEIKKYFEKMGFKTLLKRLEEGVKEGKKNETERIKSEKNSQGSIF